MADESAVLDAVEVVEQPLDSGAEPAIEPQQPGSEPAVEPGQQATPPESLINQGADGKSILSEAAKQHLEQLKTSNPQLAKQIRDTLFEADRFKRALPGGLAEVRQMRERIEKLGGDEGIQGLTNEVQYFRDFDAAYTAGDPKALDMMLADPPGQQAFMKLAPLVFGKFREMNPDGYEGYIGRVWQATLNAQEIPLTVQRLQDFLPQDNPRAMELWNRIADHVKFISGLANKPMDLPKSGAPANEAQESQTAQERDNLLRESWQRDTAPVQNEVYAAELSKVVGNRTITKAERTVILHDVKTRLGQRMKDLGESQLNQYFAVRNRAGFKKFSDNFSRTHIPELVRDAVAEYLPNKPGPKATPAGQKPTPAKAASVPGFTTVQKSPQSSEINWGHPFNTQANYKAGKAVLTNGQKVTWKRQ